MTEKLNHPLMEENVTPEDLDTLIAFLRTKPRLTQSEKVRRFEEEWSRWLGVRHSVYLNSGASANLLTMYIIRQLYGPGEIIVPPLTWVSDIASVLQAGHQPVFTDIDPKSLAMDTDQVLARIGPRTRAVFLTHVQGFNGLTDRLLEGLKKKNIPLIEDVCESHGALHQGRKCGSFGLISNFSFYFAHHMSTIEGGMVCTDDPKIYEMARMYRSHGMVRESTDPALRERYARENPSLNQDFIFAFPAFNMRGTEIGGVLGCSQLPRLDANNARRRENFKLFLSLLDKDRFITDFDTVESCNYAFCLVIRKADLAFRDRLEAAMREAAVEFRRGSSGGGSQLRQPYLKGIVNEDPLNYPCMEHIHHFGYYIGNYPTLEEGRIRRLCLLLNSVS
ncbi:MAG: DegT/DnrJ/EryC1/StrS aminotransferase family protein [Planctomycetes bacterium]|nr:DegT/DnrJ/EryC1/StrS aminotransferase family protein [Planctomycetota bacterium]